jgi:UDP-2,3-diacylglucosamine pyrophosphatase LpxH
MQTNINSATKISVPTVWISDIHIGFHSCSAEFLLDFFHHVDCVILYLVGDIFDVWEMKKRMFWPQAHNNVIRTLLGKAKCNDAWEPQINGVVRTLKATALFRCWGFLFWPDVDAM